LLHLSLSGDVAHPDSSKAKSGTLSRMTIICFSLYVFSDLALTEARSTKKNICRVELSMSLCTSAACLALTLDDRERNLAHCTPAPERCVSFQNCLFSHFRPRLMYFCAPHLMSMRLSISCLVPLNPFINGEALLQAPVEARRRPLPPSLLRSSHSLQTTLEL
jgi:hypothetical protein